MPLFKPSELLEFLGTLGKKPSKRLSQNFLIDGNILHKITGFAEIEPNDLVLEIGSGPGALTEILLNKQAHVIAFEKDRVFAEALHRLNTPDQRLCVLAQDFLEVDLSHFLQTDERVRHHNSIKVVANIPYKITTPILLSLVPHHDKISSITLMVQKEVAARMTAKKATSDYGSLTLLLEYYAHTQFGFNVEPSCFYPPPKVRSAVVQLKLKPPHPSLFPEKCIRTAFQQRRKMLRSSLKSLYPADAIQQALLRCKLDPEARPTDLSLKDFMDLYSILNATCSAP